MPIIYLEIIHLRKRLLAAPVQQQKAEDGWTVSFVMPSEYLTLTTVWTIFGWGYPAKYVVIRFSGASTS